MKAILAAFFVLMGLIGCATKPPVTERVVFKFIPVPKEMTQTCILTAPPEPVFYSKLPWDEQEALLMKLVQDHTQSIGTCNARIKGIDSWSDKQALIYDAEKPAP